MLLDADGRVLTRDRLLDALYGDGEGDVTDRAIDVVREAAPGEARATTPTRRATWRRSAGVGYRAAGPGERRSADAGVRVRRRSGAGCSLASWRWSPSPSRSSRSACSASAATLFASLMVAAGDSADHARAMFDESVTVVLRGRGGRGRRRGGRCLPSSSPGASRGRSSARRAADQIADGDLAVRVPEDGPAELRALAAAYNTMAERLAEQEAIRREFVVNASHELRTPLTNLQGYLEALRDGVLPPDPATFDSLREEVDRLTRLAASLDVLAGAEGERPEPVLVGPRGVVRASADLVAPALARRSVALEVVGGRRAARPRPLRRAHPGGGEPPPERRALHACRRHGSRHRASAAPRASSVRVANTGPGIPGTDLPHVWERFYRVEKSRDRARGGAGVGLAIVRRLVEEAGGRVGAASDGGLDDVLVQPATRPRACLSPPATRPSGRPRAPGPSTWMRSVSARRPPRPRARPRRP